MKHLRGYLELAADGTASDRAATTDDTDAIQDSVCAALRDRGYEVEANYGLSEFVLDIVVREPCGDHWQVALLLDGPRWAERSDGLPTRDATPAAPRGDDELGSVTCACGSRTGSTRPRRVLTRASTQRCRSRATSRRFDAKLGRRRAAGRRDRGAGGSSAGIVDDVDEEPSEDVELSWGSASAEA
ncbi:hypothetical protein GS575_28005 [Rhodococcus hoagii]|nr:hypothetical protein [Prescottella equi]